MRMAETFVMLDDARLGALTFVLSTHQLITHVVFHLCLLIIDSCTERHTAIPRIPCQNEDNQNPNHIHENT